MSKNNWKQNAIEAVKKQEAERICKIKARNKKELTKMMRLMGISEFGLSVDLNGEYLATKDEYSFCIGQRETGRYIKLERWSIFRETLFAYVEMRVSRDGQFEQFFINHGDNHKQVVAKLGMAIQRLDEHQEQWIGSKSIDSIPF